MDARVVIVTGGGRGIGRAVCRRFARQEWHVVAVARNAEQLDETQRQIAADGGRCTTRVADVTSVEQLQAVVESAGNRCGRIDALVNNAGVAGPTGAVETLDLADWQRTLDVNITGAFLCTRLAVPRLRQSAREGRQAAIVNLSSAAGHLGMPGRSAYSASKWAVIGFTKSLALELGADGIRVNAILPGAVDGPRIRDVIAAKAQARGLPLEDVTRSYTHQAALGRMATARDIANMAVFAASPLAGHVTGQELAVDGLTQALS